MNALKLIGRIVNGITLASYELDALVYRAQPIKQKQEIIVADVEKDKATRIIPSEQMDFALLVNEIVFNFVDDDSLSQQGNTNKAVKSRTEDFCLYEISKNDGSVISARALTIGGTNYLTQEFVLKPNHLVDIVCSASCNSITFIGEPVYLRPPLTFLPKPAVPLAS